MPADVELVGIVKDLACLQVLALAEEEIAFEEVEDGIWSIYFYDVLLGTV